MEGVGWFAAIIIGGFGWRTRDHGSTVRRRESWKSELDGVPPPRPALARARRREDQRPG